MRVGLYIRVSTQEQAKEGYSIGEQEERLKNYCKAMLWDIFKIYVDPGYSGGDTNRPGLQDLIRDVEGGLLDKVVVYKLDRLSRSQLDTLYLIEKVFLAHDTDFVSMSENFDTSTPFGRAMIGILAVFAQLEREQIKERMGMGKEARAKEGKWHGGSSTPVGYDYDVNTDELIINEYEAMQVREAVELFLKGTPLRTMANLFTEKGYNYRGRSGKLSEWEPKRFKYVFANKTYRGYIKHNDEWYPGNHTPIIDEETGVKLDKLLAQRAEDFAHHKKKCSGQTTYLGGLLFCKHCHGRYAKDRQTMRGGKQPKLMYICNSRSKRVKKMIKDPNCKNKRWEMSALDNIVFNEIRKFALDPEYLHSIRTEKKKNTVEPNKIEILERQIESIDAQISRFMDLYGSGTFTIDQVNSKVAPLNETRRNLQKELETLNAESGRLTEEEALEIVASFEETFEYGDLNEIRAVIESLIYFIEIDNEDVYIHWRFA